MTEQQLDPFAPSVKKPSVSFRNVPVGTSYSLEVQVAPKLVQARDFDTRELESWPDGNPKMTVVTEVVDTATGEEKSLWAPKPSAMFAAIVAAQQAAGSLITPGGRLTVTFTHEVPVEGKPHLNPAKQYAVVYTPADPFAQPAPAAVPVAAPPVAQVAAAAPAAVPVAAPAPVAGPVYPPGITAEMVAAVRAQNLDPKAIFPGYSE